MTKNPLSSEYFAFLAQLAQLKPGDEELPVLFRQVSEILEFVSSLKSCESLYSSYATYGTLPEDDWKVEKQSENSVFENSVFEDAFDTDSNDLISVPEGGFFRVGRKDR